MKPQNEDKIKVLEKAVEIISLELSMYFGICDALNFATNRLDQHDVFRNPKFYGIVLPDRIYRNRLNEDGTEGSLMFSYPCTLEGRQQRIEVLQNAINKLKPTTMNKQERTAIIDKIIRSQFRGVRLDEIYYNDRFTALNKLTDEELLKQSPELN